jgi:hypothetical protein
MKTKHSKVYGWILLILLAPGIVLVIYEFLYKVITGSQLISDPTFGLFLVYSSVLLFFLGIFVLWKSWFPPLNFIHEYHQTLLTSKKLMPRPLKWLMITNPYFNLWFARLMSPIFILLGILFFIGAIIYFKGSIQINFN